MFQGSAAHIVTVCLSHCTHTTIATFRDHVNRDCCGIWLLPFHIQMFYQMESEERGEIEKVWGQTEVKKSS